MALLSPGQVFLFKVIKARSSTRSTRAPSIFYDQKYHYALLCTNSTDLNLTKNTIIQGESRIYPQQGKQFRYFNPFFQQHSVGVHGGKN